MILRALAARAGTGRLAGFGALAVVAGGLEVVGVALLYLFGLAVTTGLSADVPALAGLGELLPDLGTLGGLLRLGVLLVAVKVVHGAALVRLERTAFRIQFDVAAGLTQELFGRYLHEPYLRHLRTNNAVRVGRLTEEMERASRALGALLRIGIHGTMLVLVAALLLALDWRASLAGAGLLAVFAFVVRRQLKGMSELGRRKSGLHRALVLATTEPLRNLRAVRVAGAEARFEEELRGINARLRPLFDGYTLRRAAVLPTVEVGVLASLVGLLGILLVLDRPLDEVLSSLVLVLVGATRMLPSFLQVATAGGEWWFHRNALHDVLAEQDDEPEAADVPRVTVGGTDVLRLEDVSFGYGDAPVLDGVSLTVAPGRRVGVVGPSGVGKSTLIDVAIGLLPCTGTVTHRADLRIGYVSQHVPILDATVLENVCLGAPEHDRGRAARAIRSAGLVLGADEDETLDRPVGEAGARLSGGQRQRLCLARALYVEPDLLVLDEPTASLDAASEQELVEVLAALPVAMLVVTHRTAPLSFCHEVYRLAEGRLVPEPRAGGT